MGFVAADEVDAGGEGVADELAGGGFADAAGAADLGRRGHVSEVLMGFGVLR